MTSARSATKATHKPLPSSQDIGNGCTTMSICKAAGDPLRANILKLLATGSFGVLELCDIFEMAQPAMSHHLKCLLEAGLVEKRPEGTHVFYQRGHIEDTFVAALFAALASEPIDKELTKRVKKIHKIRAQRSFEFFESNAHAIEQQQTLVCQAQVYTDAVIKAVDALPIANRSRVLEVGPGNGHLLVQLADVFKQVHGIDSSQITLQQAQQATAQLKNVALTHADFMSLPTAAPFRPQTFDAVVATMVMHHLASPGEFFPAARQYLSDTGLLVVAELSEHTQEWVIDACGDIWLGLRPKDLIEWGKQAGFQHVNQQYLAQRNGFNVQVHTFQNTTSKREPS